MAENRWNAKAAEEFARAQGDSAADRALGVQIYASRLIGADPDLVLHGGGNTSVKVRRPDLFGTEREVLHVKGSGHDLATITAAGMPGLWLEPVRALRGLDRLADRDMINALRGAMLDASGPYPSIESLLHAFLPHAHVNHSHATAMIALADLPEAEAVIRDIFGARMGVVPFYKPGFELGVAAARVFEENPEVEGLILLNHGHFAFAEEAETAYARLIDQNNAVEAWFAAHRRPPARASRPAPRPPEALLPALRGTIGGQIASHTGNPDAAMPVIDLRRGDAIDAFLARPDLADLAARGVATPDHVIRTRNKPVLLTDTPVAEAVARYADAYRAYFEANVTRYPAGRTLLAPVPNVAWIPGLGIAGIGRDAGAAAKAADLALQNIRAMEMAEDAGGYRPLDEARLFDLEYWDLEQAKLGRSAPPPHAGHVVLVTGGAGAIGLATAEAFAARGANIFVVDLSEDALARALERLGPGHAGIAMDITAPGAAEQAVAAAVARFGGLDILVSNAGAAWTGEMAEMDDALLRRSFELNFFAHQAFAKASVAVLRAQGRGGSLLFNVSKQAVNPGRNFGAYGLPKATTMFLVKQLALELGAEGIRANGINADRIRSGLLDDDFIAKRSQARGIDAATYMAGNLLRREVEARHVAEAFVALADAERTTAHIMTVDGGNIEASLR